MKTSRRIAAGFIAYLILATLLAFRGGESTASQEIRTFLSGYREIRSVDAASRPEVPPGTYRTAFVREDVAPHREILRAQGTFSSAKGWQIFPGPTETEFIFASDPAFGGWAARLGLGRFFPRKIVSIYFRPRIGGGIQVGVETPDAPLRL